MKTYGTRSARLLIFMFLLSALGAAFVSGQGGTGREPTAPRTNKTTTTKKPSARTSTRSAPRPAKPRQTAPQIEIVLIPTGTFMMGSPDGAGGSDEHPQHQVTLHSFSIGKYEVTQGQYRAVMGANPSDFKGDNLPVENVSRNDAVEFCIKLSQLTGKEYRLPTEAEWEYACRAGTTTAFAFGDSLSSDEANFDGNYPYGGAAKGVFRGKTTLVGRYQPNGWGLYDMHGNVSEWCADNYHDSYEGAPTDGSAWDSGDLIGRVVRGGSWGHNARSLRSASRDRIVTGYPVHNAGIRVVVGS